MAKDSYEIKLTGIVQGVGFRPFIYALAKSLFLCGKVYNVGSGVTIEVECDERQLIEFVDEIKKNAPPLSNIKTIDINRKPFSGLANFNIEKSENENDQPVYISPDVSVCSDCMEELFNKNNRRYLYPFINCTNCGPRFTIVTGSPYDRSNTTMEKFRMCERCNKEYSNPSDRRYHAQPISCHNCGPNLELLNKDGQKVTGNSIKRVQKLISEGYIIAIKGLGGYHLVCDAKNEQTVSKLRERKVRDDKPFALMVKDSIIANSYCYINEEEKKLLESEKKPIVLLLKKDSCNLPDSIAPSNRCLGIMLPYTPVHLLLFSSIKDNVLVMTSGNKSSEPIYYRDEDAFENLQGIADYFLVNDREIYIRTDDSVTRVFRNKEYILRRSRGYVPMPVTFEQNKDINAELDVPAILACGGELKSTFCLTKKDEFFLSHHIGDLENVETLASFEEGIEHFKKMFNIDYKIVAHDLHPEYLSTKYALSLENIKRVAIQHHHAHIAACMADNEISGDVIGVAFDGTGYGEDGNIWGGEFFFGDFFAFERQGHLNYVRMPGGDMAIKEPWRMTLSYLYTTLKNSEFINEFKFLENIEANKIKTVIQIIEKGINSPFSSSAGRLFDAVSALLCIRDRINYEGQAAIELEYLSDNRYYGEYEFEINTENDVFIVCTDSIFKGIIEDMKNNIDKRVIASKFHETVANIVLEGCIRISCEKASNRVALSGGVFQNMILLEKCIEKLEAKRFEVFIHNRVPANDGGIALGQAVIAAKRAIEN
jgi:hydrogenase maturation protein HypF